MSPPDVIMIDDAWRSTGALPVHPDRKNTMQVPRDWRLRAQRYRLVGSACPICGRLIFPPRPVCPYCAAQPATIAIPEFPVLPASNHKLEGALNAGRIA